MEIIDIITFDKNTTFLHRDEGAEIDRSQLVGTCYLMPKAEDLKGIPDVMVRCHKDTKRWMTWDNQRGEPVELFDACILIGAQLVSFFRGDEWAGFATGKRLGAGVPITVPTDSIKQLKFNNGVGCFHTGEPGDCDCQKLEAIDCLILKPGCHHHYIGGISVPFDNTPNRLPDLV